MSRPTAQRNLDGTFVYMAYGTNTATEVLKFSVTSNPNSDLDDVVAANGNYDVNSLMKTTITNENGKITQVFKDKLGRVVLTRKFLNGTNVDTYNVYDDYGQLVMVIPPDAINATNVITLSLVFCYKYDNQNRLCRKQVPGADAQKFYYDARDLLTLTQDGNMRSTASGGNANKYLGTQYDDLGRVMKTGWITTATPITTALNVTIADDVNKLTETQYYKRDATTDLISATGTLGSSWVKHQGARVLKPAGVTTPTEFVWSYIERRAGYEHTGNPMWTGKQHLLHTGMSQLPITDNDVWGVDWTVSAYNGAQKPTNSYKYLFASSNITNGSQVRVQEDYTYDAIQRLTEVKHTYALNGAGLTPANLTLSNMVYNYKDQLTEKNIGRTGTGKYLQSIDYDYNVRGWLTGINSFGIGTSTGVPQQILTPSSTFNGTIANLAVSPFIKQAMMTPPPPMTDENPDLFSQNINYNSVDAAFQGVPQYNGNISATSWLVAGRAIQGYGYTYDDLDRMTEAKYFDITPSGGGITAPNTIFSTDFKYNEKLTYDKRGNILTLERNGLTSGVLTTTQGYTAGVFGKIDNMSYNYNDSNQIKTILETIISDKGFKNVGGNNGTSEMYRYDKNGNLIYDRIKNIELIEYNYLNLPTLIRFKGGGGYVPTIQFVYDATGAKLRKIAKVTSTTSVIFNATYDYIGGVEYKNNSLERISNTEGAVTKNINGVFEYEYALRDHLGNTRVTFKDKNSDGTVRDTDIVQINHYYPFGLNMEGNWTPRGANGEGNKYQYNGKELNEDFGLGWNDYGFRMYDPAIARWSVIDALAEQYIRYSPYAYTKDNPIRYIDLLGLASYDKSNTDDEKNEWKAMDEWNRGPKHIKGSAAGDGGDDWIKSGKSYKWVPEQGLTLDQAKAKYGQDVSDVYGDNSGHTYTSEDNRDVKLGANGSWSYTDASSLDGLDDNLSTTDKFVGMSGGISATFGALSNKLTELTDNSLLKSTSNILGKIGKVTGALGLAKSGYDIFREYQKTGSVGWGTIGKFAWNAGLFATNFIPAKYAAATTIALGLGIYDLIMDTTGEKDKAFNNSIKLAPNGQ